MSKDVRGSVLRRITSVSNLSSQLSIGDSGALLCATRNGVHYYGKIASIDPHVDYVTVQSYNFDNSTIPIIAVWAGTMQELQSTWQVASYKGVG